VNDELEGVWKKAVMVYRCPSPVMCETTAEYHGKLGHDKRYFDVHSDGAPSVYESTWLG